MDADSDSDVQHGFTHDGEPACCRRQVAGLVDCLACLESEAASFIGLQSDELKGIVVPILKALDESGADGIAKNQIMVSKQPSGLISLFTPCRHPPRRSALFPSSPRAAYPSRSGWAIPLLN